MNKMNTLSIIALILIFFGGVGAILLSIGQSISSSQDKSEIINTTKQENIGLKNDLLEIKSERKKLAVELTERNKELQNKNDTIISLNKKISKKSEYIQNYLTGGKGIPFIQIADLKTKDFDNIKGVFNLEIFSKFPMYNIRLSIYDYDRFTHVLSQDKVNDPPIISVKDYNDCIILNTEVNELSPPQQKILSSKQHKLGVNRYWIRIHTRNNIFIEKVASIIHNKILSYGYQVFTIDGNLLKKNMVISLMKQNYCWQINLKLFL